MIRVSLACLLLLGAGCPASTGPIVTPAAGDRDGDGLADQGDACPDAFARTPSGCPPADAVVVARRVDSRRSCLTDLDCRSGETCRENCSASAARLGPYLAQAAACPRYCVAPEVRAGRDADPEDEGEGEGEGEDEDVVAPPTREAVTPPTRTPAARSDSGLKLGPVEATVKGDGKLLDAFTQAIALMEDLNRAVAARSDCGGRVRAVEAWSAANSARSSRVNYRVQHLSARRNYDWEAAEKAAITRHEESYERLTELLLAVCAEDGPEMARLADLDVDLRHTFHRIPQRDEHRSDARCVIMQEIRDRAVLAPTTLFGEITGDGSHHATLEPKGFICFVNGTEWNGGGATLTVACIDAARTKEQFMRAPEIGGGWRQEDVWQGRVEFLTQLFSTCFDDVSGFAYEGKPTRDSFRLSTAGSQPHVIGGSAGGEDGRYLVSVHRPR